MQALAKFTQKQLNEIWDSFDSDSPYTGAKKVVDDDTENVMTINTPDGQVSVSRKPGEDWHATPSVTGSSQYE